jgi:hypothetical protein
MTAGMNINKRTRARGRTPRRIVAHGDSTLLCTTPPQACHASAALLPPVGFALMWLTGQALANRDGQTAASVALLISCRLTVCALCVA